MKTKPLWIATFLLPVCGLPLFNQSAPAAVQLLQDAGFEDSSNTGIFPSSGWWSPSWYPDYGGAVVTLTAAHSGNCGLWTYSAGNYAGFSWAGTFEQALASRGDVFTGRTWIRSAPSSLGGTWVPGSRACVRLEFIGSNGEVLAYYDSPAVTAPNSSWGSYSVRTGPAPVGTGRLRYLCYIEKPDNGVPGQSVANFDDCYLEKTTVVNQPELSVSPQCVGFTRSQTLATFKIKNTGTLALTWQAQRGDPWITGISPAGGSLAPNGESILTVGVNRAGLMGAGYRGTIRVTSNGGNLEVTVYMDMPPDSIPFQPSIVTVSGYQVMVRRRLPNGTLDAAKPYTVKGAAWSPASIGDMGNPSDRSAAFPQWYVTDIQLLKEMYGNTVYTFLDFGTGLGAIDILDYLYKNGVMVILTVDVDGTNSTTNTTTIVNAFKDHPAILMWAIGNEWNLNYYHAKFGNPDGPDFAPSLRRSAQATQQAAQLIKSLDPNHPVISILGDIDIPGRQQGLSVTQQIVNTSCTAVDVWGLNIYRGPTFSNLFSQWKSISSKPMMLSEFGTDSYRTTSYFPVVGRGDEAMQEKFEGGLWREIALNLSAVDTQHVCLGGTVFEWNDEWWKVKPISGGSRYSQDNGGYPTTWNPGAHPDGFANEEYFGIVDINRKKKWAYYTFQRLFGFLNAARNWERYR